LDESYNEQAYEKMQYYSQLLRKGLGKGWFKFRVDGGYPWKAMERLQPYVDLWVCHTVVFDDDWSKVCLFRQKGGEAWFYGPMINEQSGNSGSGSNTYTDLDLLTCRGVGWAAWKHKSGYCQWEFDANWKNGKQNPDSNWTQAVNYVNRNTEHNGSGLLIYRGKFIDSPDPVPSARLKAHRRGFQDYEYFWLLKEAGQAKQADDFVDSILPTLPFGKPAIGKTEIWANNPEKWDEVRIKIGNMLNAKATPTTSASLHVQCCN
jgi:hypothetical protein